MPGRCDLFSALLPSMDSAPWPADRFAAHHVARCLRCQAEAARYRGLLRRLHQLRPDGSWLLGPSGAGGSDRSAPQRERRTWPWTSVVTSAEWTRGRLRRLLLSGPWQAALSVPAGSSSGRRATPPGIHLVAGGSLSHRPCDRLAARGPAVVRGQ